MSLPFVNGIHISEENVRWAAYVIKVQSRNA